MKIYLNSFGVCTYLTFKNDVLNSCFTKWSEKIEIIAIPGSLSLNTKCCHMYAVMCVRLFTCASAWEEAFCTDEGWTARRKSNVQTLVICKSQGKKTSIASRRIVTAPLKHLCVCGCM